MKYTIAVATFLGLASAAEPVWSLRSVNDHRTDSTVQKAYGDHSTKMANGRPPYQSAAQIESSDDDSSSSSSDEDVQLNAEWLEEPEEEDHSKEFFASWEHTKPEDNKEGGYSRVTPANFAADSDDIFMRSMVNTYSLEGKNKDGSPNGKFWMDEAGTRAASAEVLATNVHMDAAAIGPYLEKYFAKAWGHFDVNRTGKVEVIKMPQFMRFLASDQQMYLW